MIEKPDILTVRQTLEAELSRLRGDVMGQQSRMNQDREANLDRADLAQSYSRRERNLALRDVQQEKIAQIEKALERISDASYGRCMRCEQPIAQERLEIIPYTTYCIDCQEEIENSPHLS